MKLFGQMIRKKFNSLWNSVTYDYQKTSIRETGG